MIDHMEKLQYKIMVKKFKFNSQSLVAHFPLLLRISNCNVAGTSFNFYTFTAPSCCSTKLAFALRQIKPQIYLPKHSLYVYWPLHWLKGTRRTCTSRRNLGRWIAEGRILSKPGQCWWHAAVGFEQRFVASVGRESSRWVAEGQ